MFSSILVSAVVLGIVIYIILYIIWIAEILGAMKTRDKHCK